MVRLVRLNDLRYSPWNGQLLATGLKMSASECVRLADKMLPKDPAARLPRDKNSIFYACVFAFWTLYWEQGSQCVFIALRTKEKSNRCDCLIATSKRRIVHILFASA